VLNYGVIAPDGSVNVRFNYDHRVMDGGTVARALQSFERILTEAIVGELAAWQ
jgi:pyruvate/2-oxoglutarate dehydrogenase complex dihydrolipoamide acyltransferase (E2) component